ncbi:MAG: M23 family metallopeptidase [Synergistaceae bacterium]|nr:M23 family metallopeptidase [Synergistaceae bacterium]
MGVVSLLIAAFSSGAAYANIHSPQGALDIAAILPGKYGFMAETASSIKAIASLMKQSIDTASMLQEGAPAGMEKSGAEAAFAVAVALPPDRGTSNQSITQLMDSRNLLWPVSGYIYSGFGAPRGKRKVHGAVDMVIGKGTPIAATADGIVSVATNGGKNFKGYGKTVVIDHGEGVFTLYSHCDSILVKMGQRVKRGEFIATVGRTGRATTDHVHFEVRVAGKKLDPLKYLPSRPELVKAKSLKGKKS